MRLLSALAILGVACSAVSADVARWVNPAGGSWTEAGNWDIGRAPVQGDSVVFDLDAVYTVTTPSEVFCLGEVRVERGHVTLAGDVSACIISGPGTISVGDGVHAVALTLASGWLRATQDVTIHPMATVRVQQGATLSGQNVYALSGSSVELPGGSISAMRQLRFQGGSLTATAGGFVGGESVFFDGPGGTAVIDGTGTRLRGEMVLELRGSVVIQNGASLTGPAQNATVCEGCTLIVSGSHAGGGQFTQSASGSVQVVNGGSWLFVGGSSAYHGTFRAGAGTTVRVDGTYDGTLDLDQAGVHTQSGFVRLAGAVALEVDGLVSEPDAVLRRKTQQTSHVTDVSGPLTLRVRNSNALRVGQVIPLVEFNATAVGGFSGVTVPVIGGGRVLEVFDEGTPRTTSVRVAAGSASCFLDADFNGDGDVATDQDIEAFFACVGGTCCATCASADFNGDGDTATDQDIEAFFHVVGGGSC